jgi:ferredoxin-NADP reductase
MLVNKYSVKSVDKYANHLVLSLLSKNNKDTFKFTPGQYATISFKRNGRWSPARCFSMTNSPASEVLRFAMRPNGRFTSLVKNLDEGTLVKVQGPYGSFNIDPDYDKEIIMLANGIGITPFVSMLEDAFKTKLKNRITLLYACRNNEDIPFFKELLKLSKTMPNFQVIFFVSRGSDDQEKRISQVVKEQFSGYSYFICGSNTFTESFDKYLRSQSVEEDRIIIESFSEAVSLGWGIGPKLSISSLTYSATGLALVAGFISIMLIDLVRYVPKVEASTASSTPATSQSSSSSNSSDAKSSNTDSSNSSSGSSTTTTNSSQTYSPPVSSVS